MKKFILSLSIFPVFLAALAQAQAPVCGFKADIRSGCGGITITFTDTSSNAPSNWSWEFQGGKPGSSTSPNPTITYSTPGAYYVVLTVRNASGADSLIKLNYITIKGPIVNSGGDRNTWCRGSKVTIGGNPTASAGKPPYKYVWRPRAGLDDSTIANPLANPYTTTKYYLTVTDGDNCSATDSATLTVIPYPQFKISPDSNTTIEFPTLLCDDVSRDTTIRVTNTGPDTIFITNYVFGKGFMTVAPATKKILPGETVIYTIRYQPGGTGTDSGMAVLGSPPCGKTDTIYLKGSKTSNTSFSSSTSRLNFGILACGDSKDSSIRITNTGASTITINQSSINPAGSNFTIVSPSLPVTISPGQSVSFVIRYTSVVPQSDTAFFNFSATPCAVSFSSMLVGACLGGSLQQITLSFPVRTMAVGSHAFMLLTATPPPIGMMNYSIPITFDPDVIFVHGVVSDGTASAGADIHYDTTGPGSGKISISSSTPLRSSSSLVALEVEALNSPRITSPIGIDASQVQSSPAAIFRTNNGRITVTGCELGLFAHTAPFTMHQNYPNPFSNTSTIAYELWNPAHVILTIYDHLGRPIRELLNENENPGNYATAISAKDFYNGAYFYELKSGSTRLVKMLQVMR